jgi:hypothetical protein
MNPRQTLQAFDRYLAARGARLEAVVIGGAALNLLDVIDRPTKDCDVLDPLLPNDVAEAARAFATEARARGEILRDDWINNGPASLVDVLPSGWRERILEPPVFSGVTIVLHSLGRADLLKTKLFALCDRGEETTVSRSPRPPRSSPRPCRGSSTRTRTRCGPTMCGRPWPTWEGGSGMPYSRAIAPKALATKRELTAAMVGIGMAFAAPGAPDPNIEDTVFAASAEGMVGDDLRVLSVLTTWLGVHASWLNADRLMRLVSAAESERVRAYWSAFATWQGRDRRFARLAALYEGPRLDLLSVGTTFHVRRRGEDPRFAGGPLRVATGTLRDRAGDVLAPEELAARHRGYRARVMMGPSYRADMWAVLEAEPDLKAAELARRAYGSFATAWHVRRDFDVLRRAGSETRGGI